MTKITNVGGKKTENMTDYPSCFANYCKNHEACQECDFKESCKLVESPKEPDWCR